MSQTDTDWLRVRMRPARGGVGLRDLRELTSQLQKALTGLAMSQGAPDERAVDFVVTQARVGSLALTFSTPETDRDQLWQAGIFETFIVDLDGIRRASYRPSLNTEVLRRYEQLVQALRGRQYIVEYRCGDRALEVSDSFRSDFELATKEREVRNVTVIGSLDAISAHSEPFSFYLYPKLEDEARVQCRFSREMLSAVARLIKRVVTVTGTGYFAPIGNFPVRVEVTETPVGIAFEAPALRRLVRKMSLIPAGMKAAEYITRNREAAGLEV